ncbi:uncharacterized protein Z520_06643 [Fonsecaea multimorphosa CBS 102226]|uniref:Uncharacterized protein n=1 Tax=Fonsecaea multimorphosa CBS 102226 TaxID=1442371 RepID=A0A0D2H7S2_9EURO|nr:uncharacterized protein Z520_06643 [Fonsecaea multimorphosa CBS 102226]KIX97865.1 hypothetical protein Z520_06643 [Fonsecaea multimorphosa CBS 102226]OAL23633.1 hypothetical protein AYO22_06210 [Fonsecaea multimorphosa]
MHGQDDGYGHGGDEGQDYDDYQDQQGDEDGQGMGGHMGQGGEDGDIASLTGLIVKLLMDPQPGPSHVPKPQHAHSRFAQDPHHAESMQLLDKIASEPIHEAHLESMVHVGLLLLARMAKKVGMTAGHEAPSQGMGQDGGHDQGQGLGGHQGHDEDQGDEEDEGHDEDQGHGGDEDEDEHGGC